MFSEKRFCPRYAVELPAELEFDGISNGKVNQQYCYPVTAINLAEAGVEIMCNKEVMDHLLSQQQRPAFSDIKLPVISANAIEHCRLLRHRRLSQDSFCAIFSFPSLSESQHQNLLNICTSQRQQAS